MLKGRRDYYSSVDRKTISITGWDTFFTVDILQDTMKEFRNELLELLYANTGKWIEVNPLLEKYCGTETSFAPDDHTLLNCRNNITADLRELKNQMGWIYLHPEGYNTGHHLNHDTGKRQFLFNDVVKAKMTMKGELEYGKIKKEEAALPPITNIQNIGTNSGVAIQGSALSEIDFRPSINPPTEQNIEAPKQGKNTSGGKLIKKRIVEIIVMVIGGLILAFLIFKFGWNK